MQLASPSNRSPSAGLAVVDSMGRLPNQKRLPAMHRLFRQPAASTLAPAKITRFRNVSAGKTRRPAVPADRLHHLPVHALFPFHMNGDQRVRRWHQQQDVKKTARKSRKRQSGNRLKIAEKRLPVHEQPKRRQQG